jgi:SAM-dependent methyltransferase
VVSIAYRVSAFNRHRKWRQFASAVQFTPALRVLDVGFSDKEFSGTDNYLEKHYPYPERITALGIEEPVNFAARYPKVRVVRYDGQRFPFADDAFDVAWSNAVIEHVGDREKQLSFLKEIVRVSRKAFITTPNRHFPIEVHTRTPLLHFLPKSLFDAYLRGIGKHWATGAYMYLLSRRDLVELLAEAGVEHYRLIDNRLAGLVLDFAVVIDKK